VWEGDLEDGAEGIVVNQHQQKALRHATMTVACVRTSHAKNRSQNAIDGSHVTLDVAAPQESFLSVESMHLWSRSSEIAG